MNFLTCPKPACAEPNKPTARQCESCGTWLGLGHLRGGYLQVRTDGRWGPAHRQVAAEMLGRPLRDDEVVHHINGNRLDNRPENLCVMTASEHSRLHWFARRGRKAA